MNKTYVEPHFVYLDHNATTPVHDFIQANVGSAIQNWGNPSSIHRVGQAAKNIMREARNQLAISISAQPLEIVFTSGASESNTTVIRTFVDLILQGKLKEKCEIITTQIEHPSVLKALKWAEEKGVKVTYVNVDRDGNFDWELFKKNLTQKTALVSVMHVNNETGLILPIAEISKLAKEFGAYVHSDCVQAFGKIKLNITELGLDYASFSAHKIYGLKGVGALFVKKGSPLVPLIFGGSQERQRRGGTENLIGIWSFGEAVKIIHQDINEHIYRIKELRDYFEEKVKQEISETFVTHEKADRICNTSSLIITDVDGETMLVSLDLKGYAVSTGAACSSGNPEPSPVLLAIGLSRQEAQNSLRVSLGLTTTKEQIDKFIEILKETVERVRKLNKEPLVLETR